MDSLLNVGTAADESPQQDGRCRTRNDATPMYNRCILTGVLSKIFCSCMQACRNSQLGKQVGGMRYIRLLSILSVACAAVGLVYSLKLNFSKEQSFRVKRWVFADAEDHVQLSSDGGIIDGGLVHVSSDELTFEPAGEREREQRRETERQRDTERHRETEIETRRDSE